MAIKTSPDPPKSVHLNKKLQELMCFIESVILKSFFWSSRRSQKITFPVNPNPFLSASPYWDCECDHVSFPISVPVCMCYDSHQHRVLLHSVLGTEPRELEVTAG